MTATGIITSAAALLLPVIAAGAQLPADSSARIAADSARVGAARLDTVVITALRIHTSLASATHAAARNDSDVTRRARPGLALSEALHGIAGVQVENRYNFSLGERITVRGFGARTQFGVRGVRVLVDGIPATMPDGQTTLNHLDLGEIHSVEAVRSPVASVHGNAAGGVILMTTAPPPESPITASTRVVGGSHGLLRRQLDVGGSTVAGGYRLHAGRLDYDGYRAHNSADNRYLSARTTAAIGDGKLAINAHHVRFEAQNPGALPDSTVRADRNAAFPTNVAQRTGQSGRHTQAGVTLHQPLAGLQLSTAAYAVRRTFANPILPRIIDLSRRAGGFRGVVGTTADSNRRLHWDAGVEAATQRDDRLNHTNVAGLRGTLTLDQDEHVRMSAAFAAARLLLSERVFIQAGVRHDATRFEVSDRLVTDTNPDDSGERTMRAWSPAVGVSIAAGDNARIFANVGSAFETPTTTELANRADGAGGFNPDLRPQRTRSIEAGVNVFARGTFYQAVTYHSRVKGSLVPFEVPGTPGRQFFRNAAGAVHRGAELMIGTTFSPSISGRTAYTYTDARYTDYVANGTSYDRKRIPGVAPHRLETLLRWSSERWFTDLESRYVTRVPVNDDNSAWSSSYAVHGLRAGAAQLWLGAFTFGVYAGIDNLLDRRYNAAVTVNAAAGRYYEPGPGRTFYLGIDLTVGRQRNQMDRSAPPLIPTRATSSRAARYVVLPIEKTTTF